MAGEFQQGWGAAFSASLLTLRDSLVDVERRPSLPPIDSVRTRARARGPYLRRAKLPHLPLTHRRIVRAPRVEAQTSSRPLLNENLFRDVLVREWKRAERFAEPFALLLVELADADTTTEAGAQEAESVWSRAIAGLTAFTRHTDVMGWFEDRRVLGVVLTEIGPSEAATAELASALRRQLCRRLDDDVLDRLTLRLHAHAQQQVAGPEGPRPADPLLLELCGPRNPSPVREAIKRGLDILGSLALLTVLLPLFLVIAVLVKLKSPGPIFFRQDRIGQGAKPFTMFKFRTMHVDADRSLHHEFVTRFIQAGAQSQELAENELFKITNDPRVTAIGRILRRTSLDELPQFWNVLRGDMSLVGPRPPLAYELEHYRSWHWRRVLEAKPGITGLWQVVGRSRTSFDDMVRLDLRYVRTCSLTTDIKILLATPRAVVSGKGAC
jgi:lipopolysaccharide/colanic/teichoic acid biosynthesis glycosyltransferase